MIREWNVDHESCHKIEKSELHKIMEDNGGKQWLKKF